MKKLVFASANANKIKEIKALLPTHFELVTLDEIGFQEDIPETSDTIPGNAIQKTTYLKEKIALDCFSDDTGLIIPALNGEPGVYSARYLGENTAYTIKNQVILDRMKDCTNRSARFVSVVCLVLNEDEVYSFEGIMPGSIGFEAKGDNGFGYDPIFLIPEFQQTFGEIPPEVRAKISHRANALSILRSKLQNFVNQ